MEGRHEQQPVQAAAVSLLLLVFCTALLLTLLPISVNVIHPGASNNEILASEINLSQRRPHFKESDYRTIDRTTRRMLIGSTAPTCTYNECRGCRYRCQAEQIPVDGNDPINSAYRYKCVCHR